MMTKPVYDSEISRRTLAKGAAWSVPAIAIAAASPAAAYSTNGCPTAVVFTRANCQATVNWNGLPGKTYQLQYQVEGETSWKPSPPITATVQNGQPNGSGTLTSDRGAIVKVQVKLQGGNCQPEWTASNYKTPYPTITNATLETVTPNWEWKYRVDWTAVEGAESYTVMGLRVFGIVKTWEEIKSGISSSTTTWSGSRNAYFEKVQVVARICKRDYESNKWIFGSTQPSSVEPASSEGKASSPKEPTKETSGDQTVSNGKDVATEKPSSNKKPASKPEAPVVESTPKPEPAPTVAEVVEAAAETE